VLVIIAIPAGEAKVIQSIAAFRVDVINLHRLPAVILRSQAVFTVPIGTFMYEPLCDTPGKITHPVV
jgi:hypothetical protein